MKFESKFGIGEIVTWSKTKPRTGEVVYDELLCVMAITFQKGSGADQIVPFISCRHPDGRILHLDPDHLVGDKDFDQETGEYTCDY